MKAAPQTNLNNAFEAGNHWGCSQQHHPLNFTTVDIYISSWCAVTLHVEQICLSTSLHWLLKASDWSILHLNAPRVSTSIQIGCSHQIWLSGTNEARVGSLAGLVWIYLPLMNWAVCCSAQSFVYPHDLICIHLFLTKCSCVGSSRLPPPLIQLFWILDSCLVILMSPPVLTNKKLLVEADV